MASGGPSIPFLFFLFVSQPRPSKLLIAFIPKLSTVVFPPHSPSSAMAQKRAVMWQISLVILSWFCASGSAQFPKVITNVNGVDVWQVTPSEVYEGKC